MSDEIRMRCPGRDQSGRTVALLGQVVLAPCGGHLRIAGEHTYPMAKNPGHYIALCDLCRGYWTVGVLPFTIEGMSDENKLRHLRGELRSLEAKIVSLEGRPAPTPRSTVGEVA